jgi:hypothetical protein
METLLAEEDRTLYCPACWIDQLSRGETMHRHPSWDFTYCTTCQKHGPLLDTERRRNFPESIHIIAAEAAHMSIASPIAFHYPRIRSTRMPEFVCMELGGDVRAIHLEAALLGQVFGASGTWHSQRLSASHLERLYRLIVPVLCDQFGWPAQNEKDRLGAFPVMPNEARNGINIMAEAVLAVWLDAPIPNASHDQSIALTEIIGWWPEEPDFDHGFQPIGQVGYEWPKRESFEKCLAALPRTARTPLECWLHSLPNSEPKKRRYINRAYAHSRGIDLHRR